MLSRKKKTKESSSYVTITKIVIGLCFITILYAIPRLSITVSLNQPEQLEFDETAASPPVQPLQRTSLWVAQRTAQPAAVPVATSPRTANQVKKTVFNDFEAGPRFIFVAGIEGTGHHSFSILLKVLLYVVAFVVDAALLVRFHFPRHHSSRRGHSHPSARLYARWYDTVYVCLYEFIHTDPYFQWPPST